MLEAWECTLIQPCAYVPGKAYADRQIHTFFMAWAHIKHAPFQSSLIKDNQHLS